MYCWQRAAKPSGLGKTLVVELHRAEKLKNLMWFGSMDPICVVRLQPQQSPVAMSCVCPDGGTEPEQSSSEVVEVGARAPATV